MIRKIKTDVNGNNDREYSDKEHNGNNDNYYDTNSKNAVVEEMDLSGYVNKNSIVTEDSVLNAINESFNNNRELTNDMNKQIYNSVMEKLSQYISMNGGNIDG